MRQIADHIYQGNYLDALKFNGKKVSVAQECVSNAEVHVPLKDFQYVKFWDYVRVVAYLEVKYTYGEDTIVHCCAGMNRSVYMSLAWLIYHYNLSVSDAFNRLGLSEDKYKLLTPEMYKSLVDFSNTIRIPMMYKYIRYMMIQFEALDSSGGDVSYRADTFKNYLSSGKVLIIGCNSSELSTFSKYYTVECIHLNSMSNIGSFVPFEFNEYNDNSFDGIVAFDVLEHMLMPFVAIGEINRILREGGLLFHSTPTVIKDMKIPWHVSLPSSDSLKWMLEWWDFQTVMEKEELGRLTQILKKVKPTKFESYHRLLGF